MLLPLCKTKIAVLGGLANGKPDSDFPISQLRMGRKVEKEHTNSEAMANDIAKDHLVEDKAYYTHLKAMEDKYENKTSMFIPVGLGALLGLLIGKAISNLPAVQSVTQQTRDSALGEAITTLLSQEGGHAYSNVNHNQNMVNTSDPDELVFPGRTPFRPPAGWNLV
jgi:hypothetical protein